MHKTKIKDLTNAVSNETCANHSCCYTDHGAGLEELPQRGVMTLRQPRLVEDRPLGQARLLLLLLLHINTPL